MNYSTQTLLEYSFAAQRINGSYVKQTSYAEKVFSNRDLILRTIKKDFWPPETQVLEDFQPLEVTDQDREKLEQANKFMRRYTMLSLGNLSQFQQDIYLAFSTEETPENRLGLIAYFPQFFEREIKEKVFRQTLKQHYSDSQYIMDQSIQANVEIFKVIPLFEYDKYLYITGNNGNLLSFSLKKSFEVGDTLHITGKIKSHTKERTTGYLVTNLNYVKILEEK